jgi:ubiquinol-cytochrome c reductase iron-sulfur subunit
VSDSNDIDDDVQERKVTNRIAIGFGITTVASLGLAVVYFVLGGQEQLEGSLLAIALAGLGYGFVQVAKFLLPQGPYVEQREELPSSEEDTAAFAADFERGEGWLSRRGFLVKMLGLAAGAIGLAALFPIRSLGPSPGKSLFRTKWRRGSLVVNEQGKPVGVDTLEVGGALTVFPQGHVNVEDSQTILIRLSNHDVVTKPGRELWGPKGYVGFSKVCTHAGCPVGLYQQRFRRLLCPCHQSTFSVPDGAEPVFGPATRALPQLPLMVDDDGMLRARSDYTEPVGPGFWNRGT